MIAINKLLRFAQSIRRHYTWKTFCANNSLDATECGLLLQVGIGDHILGCGLAKAVSLKYGLDVVVVADSKFEFIANLYPSIKRFVKMPQILKRQPIGIEEIKPGHFTYVYYRSNDLMRAAGYNGFQMMDAYKIMLGLGHDTEWEAPTHPSVEELAQATNFLVDQGFDPGRTAILCIDSGETPTGNVTLDFWAELANSLLAAGIRPVCNRGPKGTALTGVPSINIPLKQFRAVTLTAGHFYGVRSGICDLVCDLQCSKIVIYPNTLNWFGTVYDWGSFSKFNLKYPPKEIILTEEAKVNLIISTKKGSLQHV